MINGYNRTAYCGEFNESHIGKEVVVFGWAQKTRDLGNLIFIDLRDRSGILQLAFGDGTDKEVFEKAASVRAEFVLEAKGVIRRRESVNTEIPTGAVELFVNELFILAKSQTPPFEVSDNCNAKEDLRLKYRYLDLRRGEMQNILMMRHKIVKSARDYYDENGFMEIETPDLIKSTPEGARDYLVPSRVHPGCFYALPQSPQLYKQLLMMSGCDRYMQVARCFRDEDLRADRQPEFTQIDMEMSFVDENDVMTLNEGLVKRVFKDVLDYDVPTPFERLTFNEAMARFGSDKPDTRFGLELCDLSDLLKNCEFKVFAGALEKGSVRAINAKGAASVFTRKEIDKLTEVVKLYKAKGLAWTRLTPDGETSSYEKFLTEEEKLAIRERLGAETGDVLFIVADSRNDIVFDSLGALRLELGKRLDLIPKGTYNFLWVTDFPLFEWSDEENRWMAKHHPFTCPRPGDEDRLMTDPGDCYARAYDMVLNGCELGGGSIRISDTEVQDKMLQALGLSEEVAQARFGFLLDAEKYGVPPHGGMAFGLDRMVMLMLDRPSIRDVIAFPKVQTASELMTQCPTEVDQKNLDELHIAIVKNEE
ncbi:MAG: aspartate--tRNA ligase [Oscillospiraceae bacterium]|nr:aspartate--tRNA ligase [Oscillospiraceae bacterium]MBR3610152.1 aspartate--tRNA ligase [Oscillospiraceae bacterium]MBR3953451.1 aspartate--tRNA ligase [Oscillospiraceae bacterium]